jgi:hypothetical protein
MIGAALGWKYNHAPGIRTHGDKITAWPASLGPVPDEAEQAAIMAEYEVHLAQQAKEPSEIDVILEALKDKAVLVNGDIDAARERLRRRK